jgi:hydroxymethylglutaryl-CoA lyase
LISKQNNNDISYPCLVPNIKGMETALEVGVKEIAVFASAT